MALNVAFSFDEKNYRHYTNGFLTVMHCHHYITLLSKLARDFDDFGGVQILRESVEDSVRPMIDDYCDSQINDLFANTTANEDEEKIYPVTVSEIADAQQSDRKLKKLFKRGIASKRTAEYGAKMHRLQPSSRRLSWVVSLLQALLHGWASREVSSRRVWG